MRTGGSKWLPSEDEKIVEIETERLRDFKEHPFRVVDDEELRLLKESIAEAEQK